MTGNAVISEPADNIVIDGYRLVLTSFACPEQYDVYDGDKKVGYLRLRHGQFTAEAPDCLDEMVYASETQGDGIFEEAERMPELRKAIAAIKAFYKRKKREEV
jgi:hypothetical protein